MTLLTSGLISFLLLGIGLNASTRTDTSEMTASESVSSVSAVQQALYFCEKPKNSNEWIETFKNREGNGRQGGVAVHRIIEADPVPLYSDDRYLPICYKYADELTGFKGPEEEKTNLKRNFWIEAAPLQYEMMHPLCFKVMADCADALEAREVTRMVDTVPFLLISNFDLLANIKDFSRFNPGHVKVTFESPLRGGLSLSKIANALRTLPAGSLVSLLEMTMWDLSEWEMSSLLKERNGIEGLLKDCNNHLNLMSLLFRYSYMIPDFNKYATEFEVPMTKLTRAIKDKRISHDQIFIAIVNAIIIQEQSIGMHLSVYLSGNETNRNAIRQLLAEMCQLQKLLKNKLKVLEKYANSPLTRLNQNSLDVLRDIAAEDEFPYKTDVLVNDDGTVKSLSAIQEEWKSLGASLTGDRQLFHSGFLSRTFFGMIISRYPEACDEEIETIINYFMNNRSLLFDNDSIMSVQLAWQRREIIAQASNQTKNISLIKDSMKRRIQDAMANYNIFESTNGRFESIQENISAWVSFQMELQNITNQLKQLAVPFVADFLLPSLLEDELMRNVIEEFSNIFVYEEVVSCLLGKDDLGLFKEHPKILYGLGNYWEFKTSHFKSLEMDFTAIRRGLFTVPPIQLASFLKSKQGMIDDPVSFIGSMSETKVWNVPSLAKYLGPYFRVPLLIENVSLARYLEIGYSEPLNTSIADPIAFIWSVIKWAINCEIYFQELSLTDKSNLFRSNSNLEAVLTNVESAYRKKIIEKAKVVDLGEGLEELKTVYNAVIKTLQVTPLSKDRLNRFMNENGPNILFPNMSIKPTTLERSINNFRLFIMRYSNESTGERDLWMMLLDICSGEIDPVFADRLIASSSIPIYYKSLLARRKNI